jgi:hypothetical protein
MLALAELPADTRAVLSAAPGHGNAPLYRGHGGLDLTCGKCGHVVAQGLREAEQLSHLVLQCTGCDTFNRTDSESKPH